MRYHNITKDDMLNGDGLRVVLWVSGCLHKCPGCHNPITWNAEDGLEFDECARGELFRELAHSYINGITYSGGDPLYPANRETVTQLAQEIRGKFPEKTQWLYTGYRWEEICQEKVVSFLDVVVDGRYEQELHDPQLYWRGSANQRVIDVKKSLEAGEAICRE